MSEEGSVLGVLLTHGAMAQGMVDAARKIAGVDEAALVAVSNEGRSPETLSRELEEVVGSREALIFTDLRTGSCAVTARLLCREPGRRAVVFGVNLAMLLDFLFHRDLPLDELCSRAVEKGRASMEALPSTPSPP